MNSSDVIRKGCYVREKGRRVESRILMFFFVDHSCCHGEKWKLSSLFSTTSKALHVSRGKVNNNIVMEVYSINSLNTGACEDQQVAGPTTHSHGVKADHKS